MRPDKNLIEERFAGAIRRWVQHGIDPGDFVGAVLCNDLNYMAQTNLLTDTLEAVIWYAVRKAEDLREIANEAASADDPRATTDAERATKAETAVGNGYAALRSVGRIR
jgi:hypothetical protein